MASTIMIHGLSIAMVSCWAAYAPQASKEGVVPAVSTISTISSSASGSAMTMCFE